MIKLLIKQSVAGYDFSYRPGETAELENELAHAWIASGIAERAPKEAKPEVVKPEVVKPEVKAEPKAEVKAEFAVAPKPEVTVPVKMVTKVEDAKKGE